MVQGAAIAAAPFLTCTESGQGGVEEGPASPVPYYHWRADMFGSSRDGQVEDCCTVHSLDAVSTGESMSAMQHVLSAQSFGVWEGWKNMRGSSVIC